MNTHAHAHTHTQTHTHTVDHHQLIVVCEKRCFQYSNVRFVGILENLQGNLANMSSRELSKIVNNFTISVAICMGITL